VIETESVFVPGRERRFRAAMPDQRHQQKRENQ
jgi:hypothetical protein